MGFFEHFWQHVGVYCLYCSSIVVHYSKAASSTKRRIYQLFLALFRWINGALCHLATSRPRRAYKLWSQNPNYTNIFLEMSVGIFDPYKKDSQNNNNASDFRSWYDQSSSWKRPMDGHWVREDFGGRGHQAKRRRF